uniref:Uncharacterized protein n=1 Tax=Arundo donax TaxID=35708 RepID=A0A0A9HEQ2_ARUDO
MRVSVFPCFPLQMKLLWDYYIAVISEINGILDYDRVC